MINEQESFLGTTVTGQEIVDMVSAYIARLQKIDPPIDLSLQNIGIKLDKAALKNITGFGTGTSEADEVWAFFGIDVSGNDTIILLPIKAGAFIEDPSIPGQYIAYETWDPYLDLKANASTQDLTDLFIIPSPSATTASS